MSIYIVHRRKKRLYLDRKCCDDDDNDDDDALKYNKLSCHQQVTLCIYNSIKVSPDE